MSTPLQRKVATLGLCSLYLLSLMLFLLKTSSYSTSSPSRRLTPERLYSKYRSRLEADTQFRKDETLGMDEHLSECWNDSPLPNLHESNPERRKKWARNFLMKAPITDGVTGYQASPRLFTVTGDRIGLIFSRLSQTHPLGRSHFGFNAMSLWQEGGFAYTDRSRPVCMICQKPPEHLVQKPPDRILDGDFVTFMGWMWGHYGHSTHDSLPWFAYLKEMAPQDAIFILLDTGYARKIISTLDPDMGENRTVWVKSNEFTRINGSITTIRNLKHRNDDPRFMDFLRQWSLKARDRSSLRNKIVYYDRRNPKDTEHQRFMKPDIERQILSMMLQKMKDYGRTEELVIFNGLDGTRRLTPEEQFQIFRHATAVVGPHGSGLSGNLLWTNPMPRDCSDRLHVVEFIGDAETSRGTSPMGNGEYISHWEFVRGWPFDYHHILYEPESTQIELVINMSNFESVLDAIWKPASYIKR